MPLTTSTPYPPSDFYDAPETHLKETPSLRELESIAAEVAPEEKIRWAQRVVAHHAQSVSQCRDLLMMLGIFPGQSFE